MYVFICEHLIYNVEVTITKIKKLVITEHENIGAGIDEIYCC